MGDNIYISFGLDNVANNLIDKISHAVGWYISSGTPKRIATNAFIKSINESDLSPYEKYAIVSHHKKVLKEYENQTDIVKIALDHLNNNARPDDVDDMWINCFMDKARLVSEEQYKQIWGRILAEECNQPNSFSKSLLFILEQMDKYDAESFSEVCSCSIDIASDGEHSFNPIIHDFREHFWNTSITFSKLMRLKRLGLIECSLGMFAPGYDHCSGEGNVVAIYGNEKFVFPADMKNIPLSRVIFTPEGSALYKVVDVGNIDGFFENICRPFWEKSVDSFEREKNKSDK